PGRGGVRGGLLARLAQDSGAPALQSRPERAHSDAGILLSLHRRGRPVRRRHGRGRDRSRAAHPRAALEDCGGDRESARGEPHLPDDVAARYLGAHGADARVPVAGSGRRRAVRLKMSSDALALQTLWRTQLALREAGYSGDDIRAALRQLDERLATASQAAEHAPQLLHETIGEVRRSVLDVLARVDSSSARMIEALRTEREALTADVRVERQVLVAAADGERRALAQDAAAIAERVVRSSGDEARRLAREMLLLVTVLAVVLLGLPFAAGYALGRARRG